METGIHSHAACHGQAQNAANAAFAEKNAIQPYTRLSGTTKARHSILDPRHPPAQQRSLEAPSGQDAGIDPLAPRPCRLASCRKEFTPLRVQDRNSRYCCERHRAQFWSEVHQAVAAAMDAGHDSVTIALTPQKIRRDRGDTDVNRVLSLLVAFKGGWVDHPYARLQVRWNDRVRELRARGHVIEGKRIGGDYQYRLVSDTAKMALAECDKIVAE